MIACRIDWKNEKELTDDLRPFSHTAAVWVRGLVPHYAMRYSVIAKALGWPKLGGSGPLLTTFIDCREAVCTLLPGQGSRWLCASVGVGPETVLVGAGDEPSILVSSKTEAATARLIALVQRVRPRWLIGLHEDEGELHALWGGLGRMRDPAALARAVRGRRVRDYHRFDKGVGFPFWLGVSVKPLRSRRARRAVTT